MNKISSTENFNKLVNYTENTQISLQEFTDQIKSFDWFRENAEQNAIELFKNFPKNLDLNDLVDFIFTHQQYSDYDVIDLLKALLIAQDSFSLSPYDSIRKSIVEDKQRLLDNTWLTETFKKHELDGDEKKLEICYDLAYRIKHPYIYCLSDQSIKVSEYTLNFLWINLNPQDRDLDEAKNIFGNGLNLAENAECIKDQEELRKLEKEATSLEGEALKNWEKIKNTFTYKLSKWADLNPESTINVWYDSALVTEKARQNTFEMMGAISKSREVNIQLRDIRLLPNIPNTIRDSLHPGTPVYYRVDVLKVLIADYMISHENENSQYCTVLDTDIEGMSSKQIFDKRTLKHLSSKGYVFNRDGDGNFENSFFIFNKENKSLQNIHRTSIIDKMVFKIDSVRHQSLNHFFGYNHILCSQSVFGLYDNFLDGIKESKRHSHFGPPRKVVKCPKSHFYKGFLKSEHQSETWRFIGTGNVPYVRNGRNYGKHVECPIESLEDWKEEPLKPLNVN